MSARADRSRPVQSPAPEMVSADTVIPPGDDTPLPGLSQAEAALYVRDMAESLRRIAHNCDLADLALSLQEVEAEAKVALKRAQAAKRRSVR